MKDRLWVIGGIAVCAVLALSGTALAQGQVTGWSCSSSAASINVGGAEGETLDPLHANTKAGAPCANDGANIPAIEVKDALGPDTLSARSDTAYAVTSLFNEGGAPAFQSPDAQAGVEDLDLNLGGGQLHVTLKAARSHVTGSCVNGAPAFSSTGQVVGLNINGTDVPATGQPDAGLDQLFTALSPLAPIVRVQVNKEYPSGNAGAADQALTREAVRIELLTAPGSAPAITVVIGRVTADRHGAVCAATTGGNGTGGNGTGGNGTGGNGTGGNGTGGNGVAGAGGAGQGGVLANGRNGGSCARLKMFYARDRNRGKKLATSGPKVKTWRYGKRQVLRGRIVNCKGKAIVNARIEVVHYPKGKTLVKTGMRSRKNGLLTLILMKNMKTRKMVFTYRGFLDRPVATSRVTLQARVLNRRGQLIR
jgi:hypothetical protein